MRTIFRRRALGAALVALSLVLVACGGGGSGGDAKEGPTVEIGSYNFNESVILAEIYAQALEANGYPVERKFRLGSREAAVYPALRSGEINFVPEYIGSGLEVGFGQEPSADAQTTWQALKEAWEAEGYTLLAWTPAEDKNGFVVTAETAQRLGLQKVSDLAGKTSDLVFGGPPECPERPRCLKGLYEVYGLDEFREFKPLDVGGPLTKEALAGGEIDVALLFTSDGAIAARNFVLLEDDKGLQPAENIAPIVAQELIDAYGQEFVELIDSISAQITQERLIEMNKRADIDGDDPETIARDFLVEIGVLEG